MRQGSSFVMAAELTEASPHHTDQVRLYADKQWVTGLFTDAEPGTPTSPPQVLSG